MMIAQNEAHFVQYTIELDTTYNLYLQMFFLNIYLNHQPA